MRLALLLGLGLSLLGCSPPSDALLEGADDTHSGDRPEQTLAAAIEPGSQLRTTAPLNLREGAGTSFKVLLTMPEGVTVTVREGEPVNGFYPVKYSDMEGWASSEYLTGPIVPGTTNAMTITGPRVREHVQAFVNDACASVGGCVFPLGTYGGHQPSADRAVDMMQATGGRNPDPAGLDRGNKIADYARAADPKYRVLYVIWQQRMDSLDGRGWRYMANRGSITQNHYDHVHVSFNP